jgi:hypothetical protein
LMCVLHDDLKRSVSDVLRIQLFCVARLSPCTYVRNFFVVGDVEYRYDDL